MDPNENEDAVIEDVEEEAEEEQSPDPETEDDPTALKARIKKLEEKAIAQRERLRLERQKNKETTAANKKEEAPKTGELDETQLDYLDLKGITDDTEIALIQKVMQKTGQTVRQALKDDYVQEKLAKLRADKEVKDATPSSTRRSGSGAPDTVAQAIAKYERTGQLPDDFALRSAVVNAREAKENPNKPPWA